MFQLHSYTFIVFHVKFYFLFLWCWGLNWGPLVWPLSSPSAPILFWMTSRTVGQAAIRRGHSMGHSCSAQVFLSLEARSLRSAGVMVSLCSLTSHSLHPHMLYESRLALGLLLLSGLAPFLGGIPSWLDYHSEISCPNAVTSEIRIHHTGDT